MLGIEQGTRDGRSRKHSLWRGLVASQAADSPEIRYAY